MRSNAKGHVVVVKQLKRRTSKVQEVVDKATVELDHITDENFDQMGSGEFANNNHSSSRDVASESLLRDKQTGNTKSSSYQTFQDKKSTIIEEENIIREGGYGRSLPFRATVLLCVSLLSFGSYFAYDSVSATGPQIMKDLDITESEFGLLYSVYSFPNIVLVLLGGQFIDKLGNRLSALLFCSLICSGSLIVAFSAAVKSFPLMVAGRFIFGLGAESSYVVQNNICVEWFQGPHLATAMGITISVSRLGSIFAFNVESTIADKLGSYHYGLWGAFVMCLISLIATIIYTILDKIATKDLEPHYKRKVQKGFKNLIQMKDLKNLRLNFWLLATIATSIYTSIFTFLALGSKFIMDKYELKSHRTGFYMSLIDITALVLTPLFGWVVDRTGKRGYLLLVGNLIAIAGYLILGLTNLWPIIGIMMLGFHFSLMPAALWPCVPLVVPLSIEGTGFAIISSLQNISLTGSIPLAGFIGGHFGFLWLCCFFSGLASIAVLLSLYWNISDANSSNSMLNNKIQGLIYLPVEDSESSNSSETASRY